MKMRPLRLQCALCNDEPAERLGVWIESGDDLPIGRRCMALTGIIGRSLPEVEDVPDEVPRDLRSSARL